MQNLSTTLILYVLMPLLAIIAGVIGYLYVKKNKLVRNKKVIFILLLSSLILALPGMFGFFSNRFMPYIYILLLFFYTAGGYLCTWLLRKQLSGMDKEKEKDENKRNPFPVITVILVIVMFISMAFFSLFFNLTSELKYGIWAGSCILPFILPNLLWETWIQYASIPPEIFNVWKCTGQEDLSPYEYMDLNGLMVLELEIAKNTTDKSRVAIKAKAIKEMPFGIWFYKFLLDYNQKFPENNIEFKSTENPYGWIFYAKSSFFSSGKYIDSNKTIEENQIQESDIIIARRVSDETHKELN